MKSTPLFLIGALAFVGCEGPRLEDAKNEFHLLTMKGSLAEEALVDPQGDAPSAPTHISGEIKSVPAPAKLAYLEEKPVKRDVSLARAYVFESKWHTTSVWLYSDGSYATQNPQRIRGNWKEVHRVLTLDPFHGGRMIFGPDGNGNYLPEDAGVMRMRKVQR
jgi:hypothetical protein